MTERLRALTRGGWLQIGVALALGYAIVTLARTISDVAVGVLSEHVGSNPNTSGPFGLVQLFQEAVVYLNFRVDKTIVIYGGVLGALVALVLVLVIRAALNAYARRDLLPCPHCLTLCPIEATVCRSCSLEMVDEEEA